jgi:hypothetical protein
METRRLRWRGNRGLQAAGVQKATRAAPVGNDEGTAAPVASDGQPGPSNASNTPARCIEVDTCSTPPCRHDRACAKHEGRGIQVFDNLADPPCDPNDEHGCGACGAPDPSWCQRPGGFQEATVCSNCLRETCGCWTPNTAPRKPKGDSSKSPDHAWSGESPPGGG